jgi:hypothetical protein
MIYNLKVLKEILKMENQIQCTIVYEGVQEGSGILGAVWSGAAGLSDLIGGPGSREASQKLGTNGGISNAIGLGII